MLLQFSVKNYTSIKDEVILSMIADAGTDHKENLIDCGKERVLPSVAIFGANAAGKTNIQRALTAAIMFVRDSNRLQIDNAIPRMIPFLLDHTHRNEPCSFDFIFTNNGVKYQYGFSADSKVVYEEYLYKFTSSRPSMIFERTNITKYKYTKANEAEMRKYEEKNTPNKLFLATATNWNCELTRDAYIWFGQCIDTFNQQSFEDPAFEEYDKRGEELKPFVTKMMHNADINISDYIVETKDVEMKEFPSEMFPPGVNINIPSDTKIVSKQVNITTVHEVINDDEIERYAMPFDTESEGTKKLFRFSPKIQKALENGYIMIIDEMESSFHPLLLDYLIDLFNNREINTKGAQLVFNTHSVYSLSLEQFRRDQIYFVEKNASGSTELYSLDEFSPRKIEDVRKRYLQGRYGALPDIKLGALI